MENKMAYICSLFDLVGIFRKIIKTDLVGNFGEIDCLYIEDLSDSIEILKINKLKYLLTFRNNLSERLQTKLNIQSL